MEDIKAGYMTKCGNKVKSWKKRWFVLKSNGFLYYFTDPKCKTEKGRIDVVNLKKIGLYSPDGGVKLPDPNQCHRTFVLVASDRPYTCICDSDMECKEWMRVLSKAKDGSDGAQYPPPTYNQVMAGGQAVSQPVCGPPVPQPMAMGPSMPQPSCPPMPQPVTHSLGPPMPQPMPQPVTHSLGPPMPQPMPQPVGQPMSQSLDPSMRQPNPYHRNSLPHQGYGQPPPYSQVPPGSQPPYRQPPPPMAAPYQQPLSHRHSYGQPPPQYRQPPPPQPNPRYNPPPGRGPAVPYQSRPYIPPPRPAPPPPNYIQQQQTNVTVISLPPAQPQTHIVYRRR
jgi:hypothetical protein